MDAEQVAQISSVVYNMQLVDQTSEFSYGFIIGKSQTSTMKFSTGYLLILLKFLKHPWFHKHL